MSKFKVYYEIFGKKMFTEVTANDSVEARGKVFDSLHVLKVEDVPEDNDVTQADLFKSMVGLLKSFKDLKDKIQASDMPQEKKDEFNSTFKGLDDITDLFK